MEADILPSSMEEDFMHQINAAVYLVAQSLYTVGYGDVVVSNTNDERILSILMMFLGAFILASTIAVMSSVIANQDILYMEFRQKMEELGGYMEGRAMSDAITQKLTNHLEYLYMIQYGKDELSIIDHLPSSLRKEVFNLNLPIVLANPLCRGASANPYLARQIAQTLKPWTYSPDEVIIYANAPVFKMYMIQSGKVNILSADQTDQTSTVTSLLELDHFGTFEFLFGTPSEFTHRTATFSEILVMEKDAFQSMMENPRLDDDCRAIDASVKQISAFLNKDHIGDHIGAHLLSSSGQKKEKAEKAGDPDPDDGSSSADGPLSAAKCSIVITAEDLKDVEAYVSRMKAHNDNIANALTPSPFTPAYNMDDELEEADLDRHLGVTQVFLDWHKHRTAVKEKIETMSKNMGKNKKFADMTAEDGGQTKTGFIILATSKTREVYDCMSLFFTAWISLAVPYRLYLVASLPPLGIRTNEAWGYGIVVDYASDVFFVLNIFLNARFFATTDFNERGQLIDIIDKEKLFADYYKSGRLLGDVLTVIPFDILGLFIGQWYLLRVPKLLMAFRFPFLIVRIKNHLERRHKVRINLDAVMATNLTLATIMFVIWIACAWGMLAENHEQRGDGDFVAAIYWVIVTITTVGFGDITPVSVEGRWFGTFIMIFGSCFTAGVIANITSMAHKVVISEDNSQHVTTCVEKYMVEKELPLEIRDRCHRYFQMIQSHSNNEKTRNSLIPPQFFPVVASHIYHDLLISVPVFETIKDCNGLILSLATMLVEQLVVEGDWIIRNNNNPSHEQWYHVKEGVCHIKSSRNGDLLDVVKGGSKGSTTQSFGEHNLFFPGLDLFNVHAAGNCVLVSLSPVAFKKLEVVYPEKFQILRTFCQAAVESWKARRPMSQDLTSTSMRSSRRNSLMRDLLMAPLDMTRGIGSSTRWGEITAVFKGNQAVLPDSNFLIGWNLVVFLSLIYNSVMIPFRCSFLDSDRLDSLLALDYIGDLIFLLDMRLRMTAFAYTDGDKVVKDLQKIRGKYKEGGLLSGKSMQDLLAALPLEVLSFFVEVPTMKLVAVFSLLRCNKMLRAARMSEHIRCFDAMYAYFTNNGYKNQLKVGKLFVTVMIVAHWLGCIFFFLAFIQYKMEQPHWADCGAGNEANRFFPCQGGEDENENDNENDNDVSYSLADRYIRSFYWAVAALSTAGYGDVSASTKIEQYFSIFTLITGLLLFSTIIANLEEIVAQLDVTSTLFQLKMDDVKMLMQVRDIPEEIVEEVIMFYNTLWLKQKGVQEIAVLNYLPARIRHEVLRFHCGKVFKSAPVFEKFDSSFIDQILDELKSDFFLAGDTVYEKGECGKELYILTRGSVDLVDGKNKLMTVGQGSLLGEDEFFKRQPRLCGAVASEFSTTFFLSNVDMARLLRNDQEQDQIYREQKEAAKDRIDTGSKIEKMKKNLKGGGKMAMMLMLDDNVEEKKDLVYLPDSDFKRLWDLFLLLCCTTNFMFIPLRVAFFGVGLKNETFELVWMAVGAMLDIVFMIDIFCSTKLFAVVDEGLLITKRYRFRRLYMRTRFKFDLLACIPADLVFWLATGGSATARSVALVRCARFIHLGRLPGLLQSAVDYLEEHGVRLKAGVWHLAKMSFFIIITTHFYACFIYYLAVLEGLDEEKSWTSGTALEDENLDLYSRYSVCLYWSAYTITLVGFGDVTLKSNAEMVFAIIAMLTGSVLCDAGITAIMSSLVQATDESAGQAQAWNKVIGKYVRRRNIPQKTQEQILGFFVHKHLSEHDLDEEKVLNEQSRAVKTKLLKAICFQGMRKFPTLKEYADGFVKSICYGMVPYLALPTEILIAEGEVCDRVFLIVRGTVHVLEKKEGEEKKEKEEEEEDEKEKEKKEAIYKIVYTLENGSIIGDFKPNDFTFRAAEYSECYVLNLEHYVDCFSYVHNNKRAGRINLKDQANKGEAEGRLMFIGQTKKKTKEGAYAKTKNFITKTKSDLRNSWSSGKGSGRIEAVMD